MSSTSAASAPPNLVLTGFMGTGKTTVGRAVAARLGRPFVDMDEVIAQRAGMGIAAIFARQGEPAFRAMEAELVRELAGQRGLVIATGGGALVETANRETLCRTGLVICLTASVDTILARVGAGEERPLLADAADPRARITALLARRAAAYAEIPYTVDTTNRSLSQVVEAVLHLAATGRSGLLRLPVRAPDGADYPIWLGAGLLSAVPDLLAQAGLDGRVAVVSDDCVASHWLAPLQEAFAVAGRSVATIVVPAGEVHKHLTTVSRIYEGLVQAGLDRHGVVVALGGGVVGDMAGFAAATFLRGVAFVPVPTTLLAMVDASVGGKVGVDLPQGKNLVGAFKQPRLVVIDPDCLRTLPATEFRHGLAEVVKHCLIGDPTLFVQLEGAGPESLESLLARALRVKIAIVERDPYEQGERAHLNLGHTFAHAFELVSGYTLPHGQAVAVGLVAAATLAARRGLCDPDLPLRLRRLLDRLGLPTRLRGLAPEAVVAAMATDKKRRAGRLRFVLPRALGQVAVYDDVTEAEVLAVLAEVLAEA